jgi:actin cytoskeleton-regulatory complex protein SLA1
VEAQFIGLRDGKIHLHKQNGVKIAVPVPKMSIEDLEYVERATGESLDEDKPLSDIKRRSTERARKRDNATKTGISVAPQKEYDWFDFFLQCGVNPQICERYANAFTKDEMGEENLPDITDSLLRTLGLKEGDILRVMKFLDTKYARSDKRNVSFGGASVMQDGEGSNGGLFSGPGGALRNNTRKGRPAPTVQTNDVVDPKAFEQKTDNSVKQAPSPSPSPTPPPPPAKDTTGGFDDNAWEVKPSKQPTPEPTAASSTPAASAPPQPPAGAMGELSLLSPPLQPTAAPVSAPAPAPAPAPQASTQPQPEPAQGANPSFFDQIAQIPQAQPPRARPQAPLQTQTTNSLIAPPPQRASSVPQNMTQSQFGAPPLQPQLTGYQGPMNAQVSPPGQSMQELAQQRLQQSFPQQQLQPQPTGFGQQPPGFGQPFGNGLQPQPTGFGQYPQQAQPQPTGFGQFQPQPTGSPFADPTSRPPFQPMLSQPTGMPGQPFSPQQQLQPQPTGVNAFLPPALEPQKTAQPGVFGQNIPPPPPIPQGPAAPLQPQKTGPAPNIRFGVNPQAKKLAPQPTGRRANLSQASKFPPETMMCLDLSNLRQPRTILSDFEDLAPPGSRRNPAIAWHLLVGACSPYIRWYMTFLVTLSVDLSTSLVRLLSGTLFESAAKDAFLWWLFTL